MFKINDLTYRDILQIRSLHIPENIITCLVGQSGAGKSTLFKLLNNMLTPDSGEIYYRGQKLSEEDPILHRRRVVMLPQQPTIFDGTIRENLNIGLHFSGKEAQVDSKLTEALELVHLHKNLEEDTATLSGGERQRISLARAYLMHPEVFLLDEPTAALDEETEEKVIESFIERIKGNNQTVVLITHSKKVASKFGENMITLDKREGRSG